MGLSQRPALHRTSQFLHREKNYVFRLHSILISFLYLIRYTSVLPEYFAVCKIRTPNIVTVAFMLRFKRHVFVFVSKDTAQG